MVESQIDREPDAVKARRLYQLSEIVDDTALEYLMATQDLDALAVEAELKDEWKKKPGPNNPEKVSEFVEQIDEAVDKFTETIHQYEPYSIQDAYSDFVGRYYELLSKIEDYFVDASPMTIIELVDDTTCEIMCAETECERKMQELCKDPRVSTGNIMQPHKVMNRLEAMPNFKKFEGREQFAISELFRHLHCTCNASSEMASHLAFLARTLQPTQFEFILKHSVRLSVQLQIPPPPITLENFALPKVICLAKKLSNKEQRIPFYLTPSPQLG